MANFMVCKMENEISLFTRKKKKNGIKKKWGAALFATDPAYINERVYSLKG